MKGKRRAKSGREFIERVLKREAEGTGIGTDDRTI